MSTSDVFSDDSGQSPLNGSEMRHLGQNLLICLRKSFYALAIFVSSTALAEADPFSCWYTPMDQKAVFAHYFDEKGNLIQTEILKAGDNYEKSGNLKPRLTLEPLVKGRMILEVPRGIAKGVGGNEEACPENMPFCCGIFGRCKCSSTPCFPPGGPKLLCEVRNFSFDPLPVTIPK